MAKKVLIAYASECGSTEEVANFIAEQIESEEWKTTLSTVEDVKDLSDFDAVILGTAIRMERPLDMTIRFAKKFREQLKYLPIVCFSLGVTMKQDTPENRAKALQFLNPILDIIDKPIKVGLFGGKVDYKKLSWFWKLLAKKDETGLMDEGDFRDWQKIKNWVTEIKPALNYVV